MGRGSKTQIYSFGTSLQVLTSFGLRLCFEGAIIRGMRTFGHPWKRRSHCSFVPSPVGLGHDRCAFDNKIIWVSELALRDLIRRVLMAQLSDRIDPRTHQLVPKVRSSPTLPLPRPPVQYLAHCSFSHISRLPI